MPGAHARAASRAAESFSVGLDAGGARGREGARARAPRHGIRSGPSPRRPRRGGFQFGRVVTSDAARRTTGVGRTTTSPTTRRDGRRYGAKAHRESRSPAELAGVATLRLIIDPESPLRERGMEID